MKRKIAYVLGSLLVIGFLLSNSYSQEDIKFVDNRIFDNPQRESAVFNHEEHNEIANLEECNECHHIYEDGEKLEDESSEDQLCGDCHELDDVDKKPGLMKAYHLNCKGCHLKEKKGPILCGECHVKF